MTYHGEVLDKVNEGQTTCLTFIDQSVIFVYEQFN